MHLLGPYYMRIPCPVCLLSLCTALGHEPSVHRSYLSLTSMYYILSFNTRVLNCAGEMESNPVGLPFRM